MSLRLYLAGPMRGYPEFNHPAFHDGARRLRKAGHEVFSPADYDRAAGLDVTGLKGHHGELASFGLSLRALLREDLIWITSHADAVIVLPGWERSLGARAETATAWAISLPVWELTLFLAHGAKAPRVQMEALQR